MSALNLDSDKHEIPPEPDKSSWLDWAMYLVLALIAYLLVKAFGILGLLVGLGIFAFVKYLMKKK